MPHESHQTTPQIWKRGLSQSLPTDSVPVDPGQSHQLGRRCDTFAGENGTPRSAERNASKKEAGTPKLCASSLRQRSSEMTVSHKMPELKARVAPKRLSTLWNTMVARQTSEASSSSREEARLPPGLTERRGSAVTWRVKVAEKCILIRCLRRSQGALRTPLVRRVLPTTSLIQLRTSTGVVRCSHVGIRTVPAYKRKELVH